MRNILKAKTTLTVTGCHLEYEGSITLDPDLMDKLGVVEHEQVYINGKTTPSRHMTYVLSGERGSECCEMNGGATQHFKEGDVIHLLFFASVKHNIRIKPIII